MKNILENNKLTHFFIDTENECIPVMGCEEYNGDLKCLDFFNNRTNIISVSGINGIKEYDSNSHPNYVEMQQFFLKTQKSLKNKSL